MPPIWVTCHGKSRVQVNYVLCYTSRSGSLILSYKGSVDGSTSDVPIDPLLFSLLQIFKLDRIRTRLYFNGLVRNSGPILTGISSGSCHANRHVNHVIAWYMFITALKVLLFNARIYGPNNIVLVRRSLIQSKLSCSTWILNLFSSINHKKRKWRFYILATEIIG